jgi:VWFA-related protein
MRRLSAVVLSLFASVAVAQVRETIDVAVTNVDLIVTDSKGRPVRNLARDEFELFEGGAKRDITNFAELSAGAMPGANVSAAAPSRAVLVLFDNTSLTLANRRRASEAMKPWLENLRPVDHLAVLTISPGVVIKQQWTMDSRLAAAAIDAVGRENTSMAEQNRRDARARVDESIRRAQMSKPSDPPVPFDELTHSVRVYSASAMRDYEGVLSSVQAAINYFPRNAQKKILLLVGEGVPLNPGAELFQYLNSIKMDAESGQMPAKLTGFRQSSPLTEMSEYDLGPFVESTTTSAARSGILVYAINPGQNENSGGRAGDVAPTDLRVDFAQSSGNRAGYEVLVKRTGGVAFYGAPPAIALTQISNEIDAYYSIAFRTEPAAADAQLVVKSKHGFHVRPTRAAAAQTPEQRMREAVLANHLVAPASNDMKIAVATDAAVVDSGRRKVRLRISIPVESLLFEREGEEMAGGFVVYVSSGDSEGKATTVNRQDKQLHFPPAAIESAKGKTIVFQVDVFVPDGLTQISVGVMDSHSQMTGFDRISLGV